MSIGLVVEIEIFQFRELFWQRSGQHKKEEERYPGFDAQYIIQDSKLLALVVCLAEIVLTGLQVAWAEQHTTGGNVQSISAQSSQDRI